MREIKFRAWDKVDESMNEPATFGRLNMNEAIRDYYGEEDSLILMQYIGQKDKNGVEIYEGDIGWHASDEGGETQVGNHEIVFEDGAFRLKNKDGKIVGVVRGEIFEVKGNIYENPELNEA